VDIDLGARHIVITGDAARTTDEPIAAQGVIWGPSPGSLRPVYSSSFPRIRSWLSERIPPRI